jgi:glycosyltransferase involved in cell wall biosynthesis
MDFILTCNYSPWSRYSGGGQASTHSLAQVLARKGHAVRVVYTKAFWESAEHPEVPYKISWALFFGIRPGMRSPFRHLNRFSVKRKVKRYSNLDTVLVGNGEESSLLSRISHKHAFIFVNRSPYIPPAPVGDNRNRGWWKFRRWLVYPRLAAMSLCLHSADRIAVTSLYSRQTLLSACPEYCDKVALLYNGINPAFLELPPVSRKQGVLFFGRFTHDKGLDLVLNAYGQLTQDLKDRHPLTLVGSGSFSSKLEKQIKPLKSQNQVVIRRWMPPEKLAGLISSQAVVVLPSREESFGNAHLEAIALGQKLWTTNAGAIPEICGKFAEMDPPQIRNFTGEKLKQLIEEPHSDCDRKRRFVLENYSWATTAENLISLAKEL